MKNLYGTYYKKNADEKDISKLMKILAKDILNILSEHLKWLYGDTKARLYKTSYFLIKSLHQTYFDANKKEIEICI